MICEKVTSLTSPKISELLQLVGLPTTGTKAQKLQCLQRGLMLPRARGTTVSKTTRVLSIDMGIRNLAFSVLDVKLADIAFPGPKKRGGRDRFDLNYILAQRKDVLDSVKLVDWRRISVLDWSKQLANRSKKIAELVEDLDTSSVPPKEDFSPSAFAQLTYGLVKDVFLPYNASYALIERQRHRSGSGPAVQEWTVRVNIFEAMLHACFETLAGERKERWRAEGSVVSGATTSAYAIPAVHSVEPRKVAAFWCGPGTVSFSARKTSDVPITYNEGEEPPLPATVNSSRSRAKPRSSKIEKEHKIAVAEEWLTNGLECLDEAAKTRGDFLAVRSGKSRSRRLKGSEGNEEERMKHPNKLDDLADCLLQGVAYLQWESNRQLFSKEFFDKDIT